MRELSLVRREAPAQTWRRRAAPPDWRRSLAAPVLVCACLTACGALTDSGQRAESGKVPTAALELATDRFDPPAKAGAMAPRLISVDGELVLSWLEPGTESAHVFRFSRFGEHEWSEPRTIAAGDNFFANWADVPVVGVSTGGLMVASWLAETGEEKYAYAPSWAYSQDGGETWTRMGTLNDDTTPTEHGFVSLVAESEDSFQAIWLDGRQWMEDGPMAIRAERVGIAGGEEFVLDGRVCDCCPTAAAMTARGPVVVYRDRSESELRDISIVRLVGGEWTQPRAIAEDGWEIAACPVNGPAIDANGDLVVVSWFTAPAGEPKVLAAFSEDAGESFGSPIELDADAPLGRTTVVLEDDGSAIVGWFARGSDHADLRLRRIEPAGTLARPAIVARTDASRASGYPRIARHGEWLAVAWVEAQEGLANRLRLGFVPMDAIPAI